MQFITKQLNMKFVGLEKKPKKNNPDEFNNYAVFEDAVEQEFRHYVRNTDAFDGIEPGTVGVISFICKDEWRENKSVKTWDFQKFTPGK